MVRAPKSVSVEFDLRVGEISGTWKPNKAERQAAWELFVELVTRISVAPPRADEELMRESLAAFTLYPLPPAKFCASMALTSLNLRRVASTTLVT